MALCNNQIFAVARYIPYYPKEKTCLHDTLLIHKYESIKRDLPNYFSIAKIVNFDIINHVSRGDKLTNSVEYYQEIREEHFENVRECDKEHFINFAIKARRDDLYIGQKIMKDHFVNEETKKKLREKNIFLSSMEKRKALEKINNRYSSCW